MSAPTHALRLPALTLTLTLALTQATSPASPPDRPWPRHVIDRSSRGADGVRLADFDGDGLRDIVTPWEEGGLTRIYLHPGHAQVRRPWPAQTVGEIASPEDAVAVDLDGDGLLDVVSASEGRTRQVYAHWHPAAPGQPWSTAPFAATAGRQWMFCLPLQIDGLRGIDLVLGAKGQGAELGWLGSPEDPRDLAAWRWNPWAQVSWIMSIVALDIDGDGHLDVLASDRKPPSARVFWMRNPGRPGTPWQEHPIGGAGEELMFLDAAGPSFRPVPGLADDVIAVAAKDRQILLFHRPEGGDPTMPWRESRLSYAEPTTGRAKAVAIGDLTGDGTPDLVVSCEGATGDRCGLFALFAPDLSPGATRHDLPLTPSHIGGSGGIKFDLVQLVDLSGDGQLDILTCEESQDGTGLGVIWYENPQPPPRPPPEDDPR